VINLHWLGDGTLSIEEVGRLQKPVVLTLHDMWAFCGAEHYVTDTRYRDGYLHENRADGEHGRDWNRRTWERKIEHWRRPMHVVAPSRWLAQCARDSVLMSDWPVHVIPNALDTTVWRPVARSTARDVLGLPQHARLLLFSAMGDSAQWVKGWDLVSDVLGRLGSSGDPAANDIQFIVIGRKRRTSGPEVFGPQRHHDLGLITDERIHRLAYAAADAVLVTSRAEAFGQVATEAQACGTPVVAFAVGGLTDVIQDGVTGRTVTPFDTEEFAQAVLDVLGAPEDDRARIGDAAARRVAALYAPSSVAAQYRGLMMEISQAGSDVPHAHDR